MNLSYANKSGTYFQKRTLRECWSIELIQWTHGLPDIRCRKIYNGSWGALVFQHPYVPVVLPIDNQLCL